MDIFSQENFYFRLWIRKFFHINLTHLYSEECLYSYRCFYFCTDGFSFSTTPSNSNSISSEFKRTIVEKYQTFDGKIVHSIEFQGLIRTKKRAALWLMKTSEGSAFSARDLADICRLL